MEFVIPNWDTIIFNNTTNWTPPTKIKDVTDIPTTIITNTKSDEEMELWTMRSAISKYENGNNKRTWEYYKKCINPYELVYTHRKYSQFPNSICMLHPLSRSYFKMIELLKLSDFFKSINPYISADNRLRSAHVCEGPGGFIEGFIDVCISHRLIIDSSVAMTLHAGESTGVPGWKKASNFIKHNKCIKILYGKDGTGNILNRENQDSFIDFVSLTKVHLFTGDGGFDFSMNYDIQEQSVFPLLVATTRIGFGCLAKGGCFIMKLFDCYKQQTVEFLCFLSSFFEKWTLYKPSISRPCNPEQYFIGIGFLGCDSRPNTLELLSNWQTCRSNLQISQLVNNIPCEFAEYISITRTCSFDIQKQYLNSVFNIIEHGTDIIVSNLLKKHELMSYYWCKHFNVPVCHHRAQLIEEAHTGRQGVDRRQPMPDV